VKGRPTLRHPSELQATPSMVMAIPRMALLLHVVFIGDHTLVPYPTIVPVVDLQLGYQEGDQRSQEESRNMVHITVQDDDQLPQQDNLGTPKSHQVQEEVQTGDEDGRVAALSSFLQKKWLSRKMHQERLHPWGLCLDCHVLTDWNREGSRITKQEPF
jgi:hypothetical protein